MIKMNDRVQMGKRSQGVLPAKTHENMRFITLKIEAT